MDQINELLKDLIDFSAKFHKIKEIRSSLTKAHIEFLQEIINDNEDIFTTCFDINDNGCDISVEDTIIAYLDILREEINDCDKILNR